MARRNPLFDSIFEILSTQEGFDAFGSLRSLNLRLTESLVLDVLNYGKTHWDVFYCVRFFDWAGRQREFSHTRATFHAMFQILYKAESSWAILDFMKKYTEDGFTMRPVRLYDTLVIGYSVVGKPEIALQVFGKMRFQGIDLNGFAYHVLLNSLVEKGYVDVVQVIVDQIRTHGLENEITHSIMMKNFCKSKDFDGAEEYLRSVVMGTYVNGNRKADRSDALVGTLVDALYDAKQFEKADALVEDMKAAGVVSKEYVYGLSIRSFIQAGKVNGALDFYKSKMESDGYTPGLYQYNSLVSRLLRENRLQEVFELLIEMKEQKILPDEITMNTTLCFFCKAGMMDAALELYESKDEFGLSMNSMAYNCLMNILFADTSIDNAYGVLKNAIGQGYFPGKKTFSVIADALCREKKFDEMKEFILAALDRHFIPSYSVYNKFIKALCRSSRLEEGYRVLGELNNFNVDTTRSTYFTFISGFNRAGRGDIAASLLIEMQEKGHRPTRKLFRDVVCSLCNTDNEEGQRRFFKLLELQLSRCEPSCHIYNFFMDGAGHARKPHLSRRVYQMMVENGVRPNILSDKLMLQSFLKGGRVAEALNFFHYLSKKQESTKKFWHIMIVGLCKVCKPEYALQIFWEMRRNNIKPSIECYEELVKLLCACKQYSIAFEVIDDLAIVGRPISSFIGNVLLLHSLYSRELYHALCNSRKYDNLTPRRLMLCELISAFSDSIKGEQDVEELEVLIQRCFPLDLYTYNMLLRKIVMTDVDHACEYFDQLHEKGYEPNRWSYDILIHGMLKLGRSAEAREFAEDLFKKGFDLSEATKNLI